MKQKIKSLLRAIINGLVGVLLAVIVAVILRVFFLEIYKIPSSSMEPTLLPGDIILVSKMSYGARVLKPVMFLRQKRIEFIRLKGWNTIKKGDVFVFNWPRYKKVSDSLSNIYGGCVVKRCYGLPGDTVLIKDEAIKDNGIRKGEISDGKISEEFKKENQARDILFPHDSTLRWLPDSYGPLYVPAKGRSMELIPENASRYMDILAYENPGGSFSDTVCMTDSANVSCHTFQHNYFFMLGDNFYHSNDSRYWGFVPDDNIIGKAVLVLISINPNENGLRKIRWDRFFKLIH